RLHMRRAIPRIIENPCRLVAGERPEAPNTNLILKPVERRTRRSGMILTLAEFIFVCNRIHLRVELVNVRSDARALRFDSGIDFRDQRDGWILGYGIGA